MNIKYLLIMASAALLCTSAIAQHDVTLMGSRVDPARVSLNPAYISEEDVVIGFPLLNISATAQAPISLSEALVQGSNGKNRIHLDEVLRRLGGSPISASMEYTPLFLGLKTKAGFFTLAANLQVQTDAVVDTRLAELLAEGNGAYRGQTITTRGVTAKAKSYLELALGYATDRILSSRRLSLGGRIKLLAGQQSIGSRYGVFNLHTSLSGHEVALESQQTLEVYAPIKYHYDADGRIERAELKWGSTAPLGFGNLGVGLDFGMMYRLDDRWTVGLSARNIGFIRWNSGHTLEQSLLGDKALRYQGIDISSVLVSKPQGANDKSTLERIGEDMQKALVVAENASFTTPLPLRLHASAEYQALKWLSFSGLVGMSKIGYSDFRTDLALVANLKPTRGIGAHISVSKLNDSPANLGLGLVLGRKLQLHLATDNILLLNVNALRYAHFRTGLNLRF